MNMCPLVTICVPTIGRSVTLKETLSSIERQTYKNYEVLILDNACPPDAQQVIDSYVKNERRARVLRSEERLHMFENFSRGIQAANGKYLSFFHDDDIYLPEFLQTHIALLEKDDRIGFSGSNCFVIGIEGCMIRKRQLIRKDSVWSGKRYIISLFRWGINVFSMQSVMFRTLTLGSTTFDKAMDVNFSDFVILMRIAEQYNVGLVATPLLKMRIHKNQASEGISRNEAIKLRTSILTEYCSEFASRFPNEEGFVSKLKKSVDRSRQIGLLWGWVSSINEADARACLQEFNHTLFERIIRELLVKLDCYGVSFERRQRFWAPSFRRIGYLMGRRGFV